MRMRRSCVVIVLALAIPALFAQDAPAPQRTSAAPKAAETKASEATQPKEESSTTDHIIRLGRNPFLTKRTPLLRC